MSKVFRLYKGGSNTYTDWDSNGNFPYDSSNREKITDPNGATARKQITSIPSPFAQIALVKTAFGEVCKMTKSDNGGGLDGNTIFHKMVSDALDIGEIFFNIDRFSEQVDIITWNPNTKIEELVNSGDKGHREYGDVLKKYMLADASTYNFNPSDDFFLLNYKLGPDALNIIGATSPATLFFGTSNDFEYVSQTINFGQDKALDNQFCPLYKRDSAYILSLFKFRNAFKDFATKFPEFNDYLDLTLRTISDKNLKNQLVNISSYSSDNFGFITVNNGDQSNIVSVLKQSLFKKTNLFQGSEFEVKSENVSEKDAPLVLPIESGNRYSSLKYVTAAWGTSNKAPLKDIRPLVNRKLPNDGVSYPYLTIGDFLEDTIIKVPHEIDNVKFFDGNAINNLQNNKLSYLLPLKPLIFRYFSPSEVMGKISNGQNMVDMEVLVKGVRITLRIPIKGNALINYIEYSKIYYESNANFEKNEGTIVEFEFDALLLPNIRFQDESDAMYRVSTIYTIESKITCNLKFYKGAEELFGLVKRCRNTDGAYPYKIETYSIDGKAFNYFALELDKNNAKSIVIPKFKDENQNQNKDFHFSVDLGTSNTHIEYSIGAGAINSFDYDTDCQLCHLFKYDSELKVHRDLIEKDFIPDRLGRNCEYHLPTRTVLSYARNLNPNMEAVPFEMANIPFAYGKKEKVPYNEYDNDIKWGNDNSDTKIRSYINCIMLLLRNKVLLNEGNMRKTTLTWFYPVSMAPKRRNLFRLAWDDSFKKYFGGVTTKCLNESIAPIQFFFKTFPAANKMVLIDIGGGTTDISFSSDRQVHFVTSFRFAANDLFSNDIVTPPCKNGIIDYCYDKKIKPNLIRRVGKVGGLLSVLDDLKTESGPAELAIMLFALKDEEQLKGTGVIINNIDISSILLRDENFKIVFLLFYTAILYHIGKIIKATSYGMPRHVVFSGYGSNVLKFITRDASVLENYTNTVLKLVVGNGGDLNILGFDNETPKEATCKGGLITDATIVNNNSNPKVVVLKALDDTIVDESATYASIGDDYINNSVKFVHKFINFFFTDVFEKFDIENTIGVSKRSLAISKSECLKISDEDIKTSMTKRLEPMDKSDLIRETLFFYPLKDILDRLSNKLYE
jgi:hypothetical protein